MDEMFAGSLVREAPRSRAAVPASLALHAAGVCTALWLPLQVAGQAPPIAAALRDILVLPVVATVAPSAGPVRPGTPLPAHLPLRPTAAPVLAAPAPPLPVDPAGPPDIVEDPPGEAVGCAGCVMGDGQAPYPGTGGGSGAAGSGGATIGGGAAPLPVGGLVRAPAKVRHVDPEYPEVARGAGIQGTVVVECVIDTDGRVVQARIARGIPLLDRAALAAVERWVYRPTLLNGVAVPVVMQVTVQFRLQR